MADKARFDQDMWDLHVEQDLRSAQERSGEMAVVEARRHLDRQLANVETFRRRAAVLISTQIAAMTLLVNVVDRDLVKFSHGIACGLAYVVAGAIAALILLPWWSWHEGIDPGEIQRGPIALGKNPDYAGRVEHIAMQQVRVTYERKGNRNQPRVDQFMWGLLVSTVVTVVTTAGWVLEAMEAIATR